MGLPPYGPEPYASANSATPAWLLAKRVSTISEAIHGCKHLFRKKARFLVSVPWGCFLEALVFTGVIFKIKMPTRGRHFFRRLGPEVPSWFRGYSSSSSSSSKKVKSSSSSSTSPRSLNAWRVRHSIITHTKTDITRPASTRMPTPANDSKKKCYSDSMLMTIFLSFR